MLYLLIKDNHALMTTASFLSWL